MEKLTEKQTEKDFLLCAIDIICCQREYETKKYPSGGYYRSDVEIETKERWTGTKTEIFERFYHTNNKLKYCNGSHCLFANLNDRLDYNKFFIKYHTIANYYGNGVVD